MVQKLKKSVSKPPFILFNEPQGQFFFQQKRVVTVVSIADQELDNDSGLPKTSAILSLLDMVQRCQQNSGDQSITFTCM